MRIGVLFFMENNLGGAATQAIDMVMVARRLGHEADLLKFTHREKSPNCANVGTTRPVAVSELRVVGPGSGFRLDGVRLNLHAAYLTSALARLDQYDLLIYVGLAPHQTREFSQEDFEAYLPIYTGPRAFKVAFFTDPFWQKFYPWAPRVIGRMHRVYAFAEAYRNNLVASSLCREVQVSNFGSLAAMDGHGVYAKGKQHDALVWPHQWRSWKNPELFLELVPRLHTIQRVLAFATGIEYYRIRRDCSAIFTAAVAEDYVLNGGKPVTPGAKMQVLGVRPQAELMQAYQDIMWTIDLTGMSARTGQPMPQFVGNYQCVTIEAMMRGCVVFKYENTVAPYSQIPRECVIPLPLETRSESLARYIDEQVRGRGRWRAVAEVAHTWAVEHFDPSRVFLEEYIRPAEEWVAAQSFQAGRRKRQG